MKKSSKDYKLGKIAKKFKEVNCKEKICQVWCGDEAIKQYLEKDTKKIESK